MAKSSKSSKPRREIVEENQLEIGENVDESYDDDDDSDGDVEHDDDQEEDDDEDGRDSLDNAGDENSNDGVESNTNNNTSTKTRKVHKLSLSKTRDFNEALRKRGVVYMSRVPPRMNPAKVKHLLGGFGCDVTRVFLVEEDASIRKRRRKVSKSGGAKRYVEGWIEFEKKKVAKHVAASLNNTEISNQKRNVHYGDLWNLK